MSVFVILVLENSNVQKLSEVYEPRIEKQSFQTNSQVRILIFNLMFFIKKLETCSMLKQNVWSKGAIGYKEVDYFLRGILL